MVRHSQHLSGSSVISSHPLFGQLLGLGQILRKLVGLHRAADYYVGSVATGVRTHSKRQAMSRK